MGHNLNHPKNRNMYLKSSLRCVVFVVLLFMAALNGNAQSTARIQNINFNIVGNQMVITYDIVDAQKGEKFIPSINVTTVGGRKIPAISVTGDVHAEISGGMGKTIYWDLIKDNVIIDDEIQIEITSRSIMPPAEVPVVVAPTTPVKPAPAIQQPQRVKQRHYSPAGVLIGSLFWPGSGNQKISRGGAWWMLGLVGYSSIAGSVVFNQQAVELYTTYRESDTPEDRDLYFDQAYTLDELSENLAYLAMGVWAFDFFITAIRVAAGAGVTYSDNAGKFDVNYTFNVEAQKPMVMLRYKF